MLTPKKKLEIQKRNTYICNKIKKKKGKKIKKNQNYET